MRAKSSTFRRRIEPTKVDPEIHLVEGLSTFSHNHEKERGLSFGRVTSGQRIILVAGAGFRLARAQNWSESMTTIRVKMMHTDRFKHEQMEDGQGG